MTDDEHRDLDELERQFRRVGSTWDAFAELCRLNAPAEPMAPDGSFVMQLNHSKTAAFLRTLPDGAGQAAFLRARDREFGEPSRRRLEAAMQAWERKGGHGRGTSQEPGA
jgi:hypothetical protein